MKYNMNMNMYMKNVTESWKLVLDSYSNVMSNFEVSVRQKKVYTPMHFILHPSAPPSCFKCVLINTSELISEQFLYFLSLNCVLIHNSIYIPPNQCSIVH